MSVTKVTNSVDGSADILSDSSLVFVPSISTAACDMLNRLASTEDGWNDRGGKTPSKSGLCWLAQQITLLEILSGEHDLYSSLFTPPFISPTHEGGVEAMWRHGNHHATLEIDLENRTGYYHVLDSTSEDWSESDYNLESKDDLGELISKLSTSRTPNPPLPLNTPSCFSPILFTHLLNLPKHTA